MCINNGINNILWIIVFTIIGTIGVVINLKFVHIIGLKFSKWDNENQ